MLAFHPAAFSLVSLNFGLNVLCSNPAHLHSKAPGHISATLPVGFKGAKTLMNCSIDAGSLGPEATANGLWSLLRIPPEPSRLKLLYHYWTRRSCIFTVFILFYILQSQSRTWWSLNATWIPSSRHVSFRLACVSTVSMLALSCATEVQLGWYASMPRRWIVINYHQVELSGWCNTGLGISHSTVTQNFLGF